MDALQRSCGSVPPIGIGVCPVCWAPHRTTGAPCASCQLISRQLGRPLHRALPISLVGDAHQLRSSLARYKQPGAPESAWHRLRLQTLVEIFWAHHGRCLVPDGIDVVAVVPSVLTRPGMPGRDPEHPLARVLGAVPELAGRLRPVLFPGLRRVERLKASSDAFVAAEQLVADRRVLLVDDTYTTGAHVHSAAVAVESAHAARVSLLVVGRRLHRGLSTRVGQLVNAGTGRWSADRCGICGGHYARGEPEWRRGA